MRPVLALAVVLALAAHAAGAPVEEPPQWLLWSDDGVDDPAPTATGDIEAVRLATTAGHLHLALATYDAPVGLPVAASQVMFVVQQDDDVDVRFAWDTEPRLWLGGEEVLDGWAVSDDSGPLGWHLQVPWDLLGLLPSDDFSFHDLQAATAAAFGPTGQALPPRDTATGPSLTFEASSTGVPQASLPSLRPGVTVEGPDFAGGASITIGGHGEPLVAYYVYDDARGPARGIYLARVDSAARTFDTQRLDDTAITRDGGRDAQMRTQVAYDGSATFVLFTDHPAVDNDEDGPGDPGTPDSVFVLADTDGRWVREDPTPDGASDVGPEDVSDLAARDGRLVAAVPVGSQVWVVERTGAASWQVLTRIDGATNAKLALDSTGAVHVAYAVYGTDEGAWRDGRLYYASSADGYEAVHVGDNIDSGWEEPETDGSYAIAVGPRDEVALLWNDGRSSDRAKEQRLALREGSSWRYAYAPLSPNHGNPQYTMRLGFSQDGVLAAASGYGGTDTLAALQPDGGWGATPLDRYDVWDMAVSPSGTVFFAYTQPHGGTTLAITAYATEPGSPTDGDREADAADGKAADAAWFDGPRDAPGVPALAALAALLVASRRRRR